ncbi:MAG: DnaD domain protein [Ruminococcus sp.]|nr:DnaD domain protein [Ruminococcus sp.]
MSYRVNNNEYVFYIPCCVIVEIIEELNDQYCTKPDVLAYILDNPRSDLTEQDIHDITRRDMEDIYDAIKYWVSTKILIEFVNDRPPKKQYYTTVEITEIKNSKPEIDEMLKNIENSFGTVNNVIIATLINLYIHYGLSKEVIHIIFTLCKKINKTETQYMEFLADKMMRKQLTTPELATKKLKEIVRKTYYTDKVMEITSTKDISRKNEDIILVWYSHSTSLDTIRRAYNVSLRYADHVSFRFINALLTDLTEEDYRKYESDPSYTDELDSWRYYKRAEIPVY